MEHGKGCPCVACDSPAAAPGVDDRDSPIRYQVGGSHYKNFAIQPVEYITKNKLSFLQGCIIKRITRYDQPGGKDVEDLRKIQHEVNLLIELEGLLEDAPGT